MSYCDTIEEMSSKITVGKIVANATEKAWSQAYHAGGFTAVISVANTQTTDEDHSLAAAGKELLDTLVAEYFTLTTKDLETVKQAVTTTVAKKSPHLAVGLIVAAVIKNVLYVVIAHEGRVLLKRGEKLGLLANVKPDDPDQIVSVSGFLENGDVVLLHTAAFGHIFSHDDLASAFDNKTAEELAETFAPKVHETQEGGASALVFSFQEDEQPVATAPEPEVAPQPKEEEVKKDTALPGFEKPITPDKQKFSFSHRQRLFLTIAIVLGVVLVGSILVFQNRQQAAKQQALFQSIYTPANTKFNDAKGLMDLNRALAIEDLQSAQQTLTDAKAKFPTDSTEEKQIVQLLNQVTNTLTDAQKIPLTQATKAADDASPLLSFAANHSGSYVTQDASNFYVADNTSVTQYDKKTNASKKIITNSTDWKQIGGFDTYFGNMYILDTKDGIEKYTSGSFTKSAYFTDTTPDLSKAVSITIDSSIWILFSDGTITKYTKGVQDSLSVTGLDTPLKNPTEILTSADLANVYILDKGNSRVVVLGKDGSFVAQYGSDTVSSTTAIDVSEKNKKLYLLSQGTVYQLDLK